MNEPLLSRELDKYSKNPNETLKEMLDESGIFFRITENTTPYSPPKIVLDTTKHDAKIRAKVLDSIIGYVKENSSEWFEIETDFFIAWLKEQKNECKISEDDDTQM